MTTGIRRWFGRRERSSRDLFILRTATGWQVHGLLGSSDWPEVILYFNSEDEARALVRRMSGGPPPKPADDPPWPGGDELCGDEGAAAFDPADGAAQERGALGVGGRMG